MSLDAAQVLMNQSRQFLDDGKQLEAVQTFQEYLRVLKRVSEGEYNQGRVRIYSLAQSLTGRDNLGEARDAMYQLANEMPVFLPGCKRIEHVSLFGLINLMQSEGLLSQLDETQLNKVFRKCCGDGRADYGDVESVHPFDLLRVYYGGKSKRRAAQDSYIYFDEFEFDSGNKTLSLFAQLLGINSLEFLDVSHFTRVEEIAHLINIQLAEAGDSRRLFQLESYSSDEAYIVLTAQVASRLALGGASIFARLNKDIDPR
jgi:hypothetical protein